MLLIVKSHAMVFLIRACKADLGKEPEAVGALA